ncbi:hypothetical protein BROUX41_002531 [Berkeleyomyces rouxiae]|uniref:uncharacterized protein n=1 Tax=Berkeleyomyces rouxiae TaxID=2035830 RepID=UPI003B80A53E
MKVCRFYRSGTCRNGNNCKFEHPGADKNSGSTSDADIDDNLYKLSRDAIKKDLTSETPQWILSAYGPGVNAPEQLWGGFPLEQSVEEIRWHYLASAQSGKQAQALEEITKLYQEAQGRIHNTALNIDDAICYINSAGEKHPNRIDIVAQATSSSTSASAPNSGPQSNNRDPFGSSSRNNNTTPDPSTLQNASMLGGGSSVFGQTSALGQKPTPFAQPAFGRPSQPNGGSTFGQPSNPGSNSAFGQQSAFGAATSNNNGASGFGTLNSSGPTFGQSGFGPSTATTFGQTSVLGQKPAFGKPSFGQSGFGQPSFGTPAAPAASGGGAFGQSSQPAQTSAFGQASQMSQSGGSAFGQSGGGGFGQPSQSGGSTFGQPSQLGNTASTFGQPSQLGAKPSVFGSSSTPNTGNSTASGFGAFAAQGAPGNSPFAHNNNNNSNNNAMTTASSPFGGGSTSAGSPFGQSSNNGNNPFSSTNNNNNNAPGNTFGQQATAKPNPFGAAATPGATSTFGQPSKPGAESPFAMANNSSANASSGFSAPSVQANPFNTSAAPTTPAKPTSPYPPDSGKQHPPLESYTTCNPVTHQLASFKNQQVEYVSGVPGIRETTTGNWYKIIFPNGAPINYPATEIPLDKMDAKAKQQWEHFATTGSFSDGKIPMHPPPRVACMWDF